jgi:hypothetical protein
MAFFGDQPHLLLGDPDFSLDHMPSLTVFEKLVNEGLEFRHIQGAHSYIHAGVEFDNYIGIRPHLFQGGRFAVRWTYQALVWV